LVISTASPNSSVPTANETAAANRGEPTISFSRALIGACAAMSPPPTMASITGPNRSIERPLSA